MKKSFTQEQIVATLRSVEGGTSIADACRKLGITEQTFYRWKRKFAGMGVAEVRATDTAARLGRQSGTLWLPAAACFVAA